MSNEELVDNVVSMFIVEETSKPLLKAVATAIAIRKDQQFKECLQKIIDADKWERFESLIKNELK